MTAEICIRQNFTVNKTDEEGVTFDIPSTGKVNVPFTATGKTIEPNQEVWIELENPLLIPDIKIGPPVVSDNERNYSIVVTFLKTGIYTLHAEVDRELWINYTSPSRTITITEVEVPPDEDEVPEDEELEEEFPWLIIIAGIAIIAIIVLVGKKK